MYNRVFGLSSQQDTLTFLAASSLPDPALMTDEILRLLMKHLFSNLCTSKCTAKEGEEEKTVREQHILIYTME